MVNFQRGYATPSLAPGSARYSVASTPPMGGYFQPGGYYTPPPPPPNPVTPPKPGVDKAPKGFGPLIVADLGKMVLHPWITIKSIGLLTWDLITLVPQRHLTVATSTPAMARYQTARLHLDAAPFRHLLPFFEWGLDAWATGRFKELAPEIQGRLTQRVGHPIMLEWPQGGTGHNRLSEVLMVNDAATTASDGQIMRALLGLNRIQFTDSKLMDYFFPLALAGDALVLRRNLPILPGQKTLAQTLAAYMQKKATVNANV